MGQQPMGIMSDFSIKLLKAHGSNELTDVGFEKPIESLEVERDREIKTYIYMYINKCIHIYIYINR